MLYRVIRPLLFRLPAERAHHLAMSAMRGAQLTPLPSVLRPLLTAKKPVSAFGLQFNNPIGLAAGFDKDAQAFEMLGALGFGFIEVGTLTALAQQGNPTPRLFRLPRDRALINRMGFNNRGSADAVPRLSKKRRALVGVNIGKSKLAEDPVADYVTSAERVAPYADYLVVNVSSPNTPGLRDLQAVSSLRPILAAVRDASHRSASREVPLLVKIAPDLANDDVDAIADLALEQKLAGIIATNTTTSRAGLATPANVVDAIGRGGLSGAPQKQRSQEVLERLATRVGGALTLVAAGGIENAQDVRDRLNGGATLVQVYTSFIYGGPLHARRLAARL